MAIATSACGWGGAEVGSEGEDPVPLADSDDALCRYLAVPLGTMKEEGLTFEGLVSKDPKDKTYLGGMLALSRSMSTGQPGRFKPVLFFLADRGRAVHDWDDEHHKPPKLTPEIVANAKALDKELATGRCDE